VNHLVTSICPARASIVDKEGQSVEKDSARGAEKPLESQAPLGACFVDPQEWCSPERLRQLRIFRNGRLRRSAPGWFCAPSRRVGRRGVSASIQSSSLRRGACWRQ